MPILESKNEEEHMPQRQTTSMFPDTARPSRPRWQHWLAACLLAAGFGGHAAVHAADVDGEVDWRGQSAGSCQQDRAGQAALSRIAQQLQAQGMALKARCHGPSGAWRVEVTVVDGLKASKVVRGPLADGHEVDMGTPAGVPLAAASLDAGGFSPDVQFNRQWLRTLMAQHRFSNLPDAWWHFAQQGSGPVSVAAR